MSSTMQASELLGCHADRCAGISYIVAVSVADLEWTASFKDAPASRTRIETGHGLSANLKPELVVNVGACFAP